MPRKPATPNDKLDEMDQGSATVEETTTQTQPQPEDVQPVEAQEADDAAPEDAEEAPAAEVESSDAPEENEPLEAARAAQKPDFHVPWLGHAAPAQWSQD